MTQQPQPPFFSVFPDAALLKDLLATATVVAQEDTATMDQDGMHIRAMDWSGPLSLRTFSEVLN